MRPWPTLEYNDWLKTYQTLHRWLQIVGKVRVNASEQMNHSWNSAMYVTPVGLSTSPIPNRDGSFSIDFDFSEHSLKITTSEGETIKMRLQNESVADFFTRFMRAMNFLAIETHFDPHPNELPDARPFPDDAVHCTYVPEHAQKFGQVLVKGDLLLKKFRSRFTGKASPVHFFWGSFDLAVTRFSGKPAPEHPGGIPHLSDLVVREAYSHEVSSCGFWPGNEAYPHAAFYSYAYPEPAGFRDCRLGVEKAFYHDDLHEFLLPYDIVRKHASPEALVLTFFEETFDAVSRLGEWDREILVASEYLQEMWRHRARPLSI